MAKKAYFGQIGKLKKDKIEEYETLHANTWPHIRQLLRDCNLENYSIFRYEDLVFSYYEYVGDDYEADMAKMAADPETQRWWAVCKPLQRPLPTRKEGEWWADMDEFFHLD